MHVRPSSTAKERTRRNQDLRAATRLPRTRSTAAPFALAPRRLAWARVVHPPTRPRLSAQRAGGLLPRPCARVRRVVAKGGPLRPRARGHGALACGSGGGRAGARRLRPCGRRAGTRGRHGLVDRASRSPGRNAHRRGRLARGARDQSGSPRQATPRPATSRPTSSRGGRMRSTTWCSSASGSATCPTTALSGSGRP